MMTMTRGLLQPEILQPEKHTKAITVDNTKPGKEFHYVEIGKMEF